MNDTITALSGTSDDRVSPSGYDPSPFLVNKPWPLRWQLVVALLGGVVPAAVIASVNGERLGIAPARRRLSYVIAVLGLIAMVYLAWHRVEALSLALASEKFRASQLASLAVAVLAWPFLALLQLPELSAHARAGRDFGKLWSPGLMAVVLFGVPQRLLVWGLVLLLTRS